ncbi:MAG: hypothetical protein JO299_12890 [Gammaproteobacteria bacterium]|nr:hypothetical protein [Gammaproteobacteria bacterium]
MRLLASALAVLLTPLTQTAHADTHCYGFRNDSKDIVTLSFSYHPPVGNVITGAALDPGKTYPFDGRPWCWNLPEDTTATVAVSGPATPQWKGSLVLGNRAGTTPSGTYVLGPASTASTAPAAPSAVPGAVSAAAAAKTGAGSSSASCLANNFPNNDAYCLTGLQSDVPVQCGTGHTGISGTLVVSHLKLQCRNGRKLALTCGTTTGGRQKCNISDQLICTDESVRNAADYCGG